MFFLQVLSKYSSQEVQRVFSPARHRYCIRMMGKALLVGARLKEKIGDLVGTRKGEILL